MKFFFLSTKNGSTHIIVAKSPESARKIAELSNTDIEDLYEVKEDTFKDEGFLVNSEESLEELDLEETLYKQFELLAERSKNAYGDELCRYTSSMLDIIREIAI